MFFEGQVGDQFVCFTSHIFEVPSAQVAYKLATGRKIRRTKFMILLVEVLGRKIRNFQVLALSVKR
jgi:hypothetical protein